MTKDLTAAFIVPTGVGASIGGFAGDASSAARMIAKHCRLIVNPNVVNAAVFSGITENMLYTEGYAIDSFFKGETGLRPSCDNKIGIIFDKSIPQDVLNIHINTVNAVTTVYGIDAYEHIITDEPVGIEFTVTETGISTGIVENPQTLINAGAALIKKGCEALAVVCLFDDSEDEDYSKGKGVDPVGGVEAIISHLLTREFNIPTAHAPAFKTIDISSEIVNPKAAAEYITPTFLPCILIGLSNAPKLIPIDSVQQGDITVKDLNALIVPYDSLGGIPVLQAVERNISVIAVRENSTVLNVNAESLGLDDIITEVNNYRDVLDILY